MYYLTKYDSSLIGPLTIASDGKSIVGLWLDGQKYHAATISGEVTTKDDLQVFTKTKKWLDRYFAGKNPSIDELPLAPCGNDFRQAVWDILVGIPYGEYTSYGEIARRIADGTGQKTMSAQAVGGAVGHNPISIIIPCHRVVGANGSLTGYAGGIDKKIILLEHEGVDLSRLSIPTRGTAL